MPTADYSSYHQPSGTGADGTKFDNLIDAIQTTINALDTNNLAAAAGIKGTQIAAGANIVGTQLAAAAAIAPTQLAAGSANQVLTTVAGVTTWATAAMVQLYDTGFTAGANATFDSGAGGFATTYNKLIIDLLVRGDTAANTTASILRFNNDTSATYTYSAHMLVAAVTENGATSAAPATSVEVFNNVGAPANTAPAGEYGIARVELLSYGNTTQHKHFQSQAWSADADALANMRVIVEGGRWKSTAAINRVTFAPAAGNWAVGSRMTIYGVL